MALNGLGPRAVQRLIRATGLNNIVRATVVSHGEFYLVRLTLDPHQHGVYDRRDGELELDPPGKSDLCTSLCWELFPEGAVDTSPAKL